ncbi:sugar ABC transporter substrate-binding protein [Nocardioides daeguensis]|uniref:D-ribose ABC transporter substrate-binding protein n=1 Tax=Nocardioides daeguensis TaxID=908359 RepID=A0ABP6V001_9ACTN|nr:sugar ABC transporter substrate-binding protein [Nocardioides daeguensis]MBV6727203.1 sugar ABC transporter substrate-binding protein [Nocardioides daeguensis]MCR1771217.1 sugar ABC transporter substrate-binding protein [Nocardioides daeguensis]
MRRSGLAISVGAVLALALSACGNDAASDSGDDTIQVAFFSPVGANAVTAAQQEGMRALEKKLDAELTVFDAGFDQNKQLSQMQDAIATGIYEAFVVMPVNGAALVQPTKEAIEAGITVVADWNNIGPDIDSIDIQIDGLAAVVASKLSDQGRLVGEKIIEACENVDPCTAVYMPGNFKQASEAVRMDTLKSLIAEHDNIELKMSAEGGYSSETSLKAASDVIRALPDLDVFATPDDVMVGGIIQALEDADMLEKVKTVSVGASKTAVKQIRDGKLWATMVTMPASEGATSFETAVRAARGEDVENVDSRTLSPIGDWATVETLSTPEGEKFTGEW